jgi:hypothetical protein
VLRRDGTGYLAVPNRWGLFEPHFRLVGLSWLPTNGLQSAYVRLARRGERYDCRLLSRSEVQEMFQAAGLDARERTAEAMEVMDSIEEPSQLLRAVLRSPDALSRIWMRVVPTVIFTFRRSTVA